MGTQVNATGNPVEFSWGSSFREAHIIKTSTRLFVLAVLGGITGCGDSPPSETLASVSGYLDAANAENWGLTARYADSAGIENAKWLKRNAPELLSALANDFTPSDYFVEGDTARLVAAVPGSKSDDDKIQVALVQAGRACKVHFVTPVGHSPR